MSTSPDTASTAIRLVTARSVDLAGRRPIALIADEAVDLDVRAGRLDDDRGPPGQLDLEVGRRPPPSPIERSTATRATSVPSPRTIANIPDRSCPSTSRIVTRSASTRADPDVAIAQPDRHDALGAEGVLEGRADRGRGHDAVLPSARIAAAASSALISWRASGLEDLLAGPGRDCRLADGLVDVVRIGAWPEAERPDERLDPGPDGRVADPELALHLAQVPARAQEALEQRQLVAVQAPEPPDAEVAFEGRPAAPAMEARDGQLVGADGTGGDDVVWHRGRASAGWPGMRRAGRPGGCAADPDRTGSTACDLGGRLEQLPSPEVGLDLALAIGAGQLDEL